MITIQWEIHIWAGEHLAILYIIIINIFSPGENNSQ